MDEDAQLEQIINQTLDGAIATIPAHLEEIERNKEIIQAKEPKEFVYGLVMGIALGMASALMTSIKKGIPTQEDQLKIRDMVYKRIPQIRERIFQ